jgi:hypothetical protein
LRLTGSIPFIGQIISISIGGFICAYINKKETMKFGKIILKEYNLDYDIKNTETPFKTFLKIAPWVIIIVLILFIYFNMIKNNGV